MTTTPTNWQKSSYSGGGDGNNCLEVAISDTTLLLRESDSPTTTLTTSRLPIAALIRHLREQ